ncbi:MAG: Ig domain-containing protein [Gemmatimonadetes bacterium]|nr:Ig domain-containing protein [Gemmatimonadota bacterium]
MPVAGNSQPGAAGLALADSLVVQATDAGGRAVPSVGVTWTVQAGGGSIVGRTLTNASGRASARWTLGTVAGSASVLVSAGDRSATFTATVRPGEVSSVGLTPTSFTLDPGTQRQLQLAVADAFGNSVSDRPASWDSSEPLIATVDNTGTVRGVAGGIATIRATVDARSATATVTVTGPPAPLPTITGLVPAVLAPGLAATISGTSFAVVPGGSLVTINGVAATVTAAAATELQIAVPGADRLGCLPLTTVEVAVKVGSARAVRPHPRQTATRRTLGVSDVVFGTAAAGLGCSELAAGSGRYLVAVYNVGPAFAGTNQQFVNAGPGIQLRTSIAATSGDVVPSALAPAFGSEPATGPPLAAPETERALRHLRAHERVMDANARALRRVPLPAPAGFAARAALYSAVPGEGATLWIRFPDVSKESSLTCSQFDSVRARVVQVGTRAIVLEDIAAPLAGQLDTLYQRLATQFDQVQYPVIRDNFGDPLVLDGQLNNDGHVYMLFTRRVNGLYDGKILGYVWSGDFDDGTWRRLSNRAEIFYGIVPTVLSGGGSRDWDPASWYNYARSTVVHELKHVASMAARFHNHDTRFSADSMWLEEAGAMVSEEIWARRLFGYQQRGNVGFNQSIYCELNLTGSGCTGMPIVMLNHFAFLYDYYERSDSLSFFGRAADGDATFYGSAWAFLRWLADHSGMAESEFLTRLTQASTAGLTSIQTVPGRSYEDLFRDFVLATALDDRPGFTSTNPRLSQPSWNTRDIFSGMSRLRTTGGGIPFPLSFPLVARTLSPPGASVGQVRPGGAALFEFEVPSSSGQALEVVAADGGALAPGLRVAIVRVQ